MKPYKEPHEHAKTPVYTSLIEENFNIYPDGVTKKGILDPVVT